MSNFMVTGANGFVGLPLCERLLAAGHGVRAVVRENKHATTRAVAPTPSTSTIPAATAVHAASNFVDLSQHWPENTSCDVAIHLAARVHVMHEAAGLTSAEALALYRETNVQGSLRVAQAAKRAGVSRFVYVSSVKAMGEGEPGTPPHPWTESDIPTPGDAYGITKREAELALMEYCATHSMSLAIIRPPLVYGPQVRANFLQLMSVVGRGLPLPLGSVDARRSMVYVDNLVDAIITLAEHPLAAGHCFNVSDGEDLSVASIADILGDAMGRPARLLRIPPSWLSKLARLAGQADKADRLLRPLRLDIHKIQTRVQWHPPYQANEGLRRTAIWYRDAFLTNR